MTRYLVTGGSGFIGSHIVHALLRRGEEVRVFDNFFTGRRENLEGLPLEIIEGDLRDPDALGKAVKGVECVFHQAALPSVVRSIQDPPTTHSINATGTLYLLQASLKADVRRIIYASSSSVYGDSSTLPKHEGMSPAPISPYAVSKLAGEEYCQVFWKVYGLETVCLRYFNVFGPRQDPNSQYAAVIPRFIDAALNGGKPTVFGGGSQSRDFTYVDNVVDANLLAVSSGQAVGEVINIACGERVSLLDLLRVLSEISGKEIFPVFVAARPGDIKHSQASIAKAEAFLGYRPRFGFSEGLRKTLEWFAGADSRL